MPPWQFIGGGGGGGWQDGPQVIPLALLAEPANAAADTAATASTASRFRMT
jgi:hypothetical protein